MHRRIARRLQSAPGEVIGKARENLRRWRETRGGILPPALEEWERLLDRLPPDELNALLVAEDEEAVRLRQSSPFAGVLPPQEVWSIKGGRPDAAA